MDRTIVPGSELRQSDTPQNANKASNANSLDVRGPNSATMLTSAVAHNASALQRGGVIHPKAQSAENTANPKASKAGFHPTAGTTPDIHAAARATYIRPFLRHQSFGSGDAICG
jgi:hypothetical protein